MTDNSTPSTLINNAAATAGRALDQQPFDNGPAALAAIATGDASSLAARVPLVGPPLASSDLQHLAMLGAQVQDPTTVAARGSVPDGVNGYDIGVGLLRHRAPASLIAAIRGRLHGFDQRAFDVAAALHIGRVIGHHDPGAPPDAAAGFAVRHGVIGTPPSHALVLVNTVAQSTPAATAGAQIANKQIDAAKAAHAARTGVGFFDVALVGVGLAAGGWWWGLAGAGIGGAIGGAVDAIRRHFTK